MLVAESFDKIRINPGNFADGRKSFEVINYEDEKQYQAEVDYIEEVFTPLVLKCKQLGRAMRVGTNHGSLSARHAPRPRPGRSAHFSSPCRGGSGGLSALLPAPPAS